MLAALGLVLAGGAASQGPETVSLELTVAQLSDEEGPIDPRGRKIHAKLVKEVRYGGLSVVEARRMKLGMNEVGKLKLPNGKAVQVRPMLVDDRGLLMAVDVEGVLHVPEDAAPGACLPSSRC